MTWADFIYADWHTTVLDVGGSTLLDKFPLLKAHMHHIREMPNIKKYIATRPERRF